MGALLLWDTVARKRPREPLGDDEEGPFSVSEAPRDGLETRDTSDNEMSAAVVTQDPEQYFTYLCHYTKFASQFQMK